MADSSRQSKFVKKPHLKLTPPEVLENWRLGYYTPKGYLYHLILAQRKMGWWFRIEHVSQFCREWEIQRRTFYRAKAALIEEGKLEEDIIGTLILTAPMMSTNTCDSGDTPVSEVSLPVSEVSLPVTDLSQPVTDLSQSSAETLSGELFPDPTDLLQISFRSPTPCVGVEKVFSDQKTNIHDFVIDLKTPPVQNLKSQVEPTASEKDQFSAPPILQRAKKYGVNIEDQKLKAAIERFPERVERAIQCLDEKQLTVKHPTRFLEKAILEDWRPEKAIVSSEWKEWYTEAHKRGLVVASQRQNDVINVLTSQGQWVTYEHLRRVSWDELQQRLNPTPQFVSETIKNVSMHPEHGQVLDVSAIPLVTDSAMPVPSGNRSPSPQAKSIREITDRIKALRTSEPC